jgi:methyltransferase
MIEFGLPQIVVLLVAAQRLGELVVAQRNTKRLLREGGREIGARHYPLFVLLHAGWLVAMFLLIPSGAPASVPLLAIFGILQLLRVWIVLTLGRYWTTRIITVPGAPLVQCGPYRFLRHPNYVVVIGEIALLPLAFGAWQIALVFSILNLALLWHRIRIEDTALAARR